ncbi:hypothetical protein [Arenimonas malthae]|uniref:hypothetical protein n=1 Tax=Arenimonas malthae TaxID=354197 RepID=UPI0012EB1333|nr:hypothetical protein [Arenimonas malthae]
MQRALLTACLATTLAGCKSVDFGWSPTETGCVERGLFEAMEEPGDLPEGDLGNTDIRVGRLPDTGNGLAYLVHFDRRFGGLGQVMGSPRVRLSVGDWNKRTCTVVMDQDECPESAEVYQRLASQSLPLGFLFEDPSGLSLMHGTTYYLQAFDGNGNETRWSYYGSTAHPLQNEIDRAIDGLSRCLSHVQAAYRRGPSN